MTAGSRTVRVFVALDLPAEVKDTLADTMEQLQATLPAGIRWVDPAGIHLTLKFLGNIDAGLVADLLGAMGRGSSEFDRTSFELRLAGLGVFPNQRQPRVLWAGVAGDTDALGRLQGLVEDALADLGFSREGRPFRPHLTIGRVRDRVDEADLRRIGKVVSNFPLAGAASWPAAELYLIRSTLTPAGSIYDSIGSAPLGRAD